MPKETKGHSDFDKVLSSVAASVILTPPRRFLNNATNTTGIFAALTKTWEEKLITGATDNIARSTLALLLQLKAMEQVEKKLGPDNNQIKLLAGAIAPLPALVRYETRLIQRPTGQFCLVLKAPYIASLAMREYIFSWFVFNNKSVDFPQHFSVNEVCAYSGYLTKLIVASAISGGIHRFVVSEALAPVVDEAKTGTMPNLGRDGVKKTISQLAHGRYTHPSYAPRYPAPIAASQKIMNVLNIFSCTMVTARFGYLLTASFVINKSLQYSGDVRYAALQKFKFNQHAVKPELTSDLTCRPLKR